MSARGAAGLAAHVPSGSDDRDEFYRFVLEKLRAAGISYLVGGAYGLACVTDIAPRIKDLDLFLRRDDCADALAVMAAAGCVTEVPFRHWLAKVRRGEHLVDIIFNSGNGRSPVDDAWFRHALPADVCGIPVLVCPLEEMLWTKAFVMERERYDGADIAHLLRACATRINWRRLLDRFGEDWPVLLSHLVLFTYVYPGEAERVPRPVVAELTTRWQAGSGRRSGSKLCRGGLLSRGQYRVDLEEWGYVDARLPPHGSIEPDQLAVWNAAAPAAPRAVRCAGKRARGRDGNIAERQPERPRAGAERRALAGTRRTER